MKALPVSVAAALFLSASAGAQNVGPAGYAYLQTALVPVTEGDVTDRPYRQIGIVTGRVRKATAFSRRPTVERAFAEMWKNAKKMGADAVIKAQVGDEQETFRGFGAREARGMAIKFLTDAEIAALPKPAAPPPQL